MQHTYRKLKTHKTAVKHKKTSEPSSTMNSDEISQQIIKTVKSQGKSVPLQAWTGPEGSRKLWFPDFVTTAQDGGKVVSRTHRPPLPPGNTPGTHLC